jgi:predicted heme/steroid binding protein
MDVLLVAFVLVAVYLLVFRVLVAARQPGDETRRLAATVAGLVLAVLAAHRGMRLVLAEPAPITMTRSELAKFTGVGGGPIYLAVRGRIYDVSSGRAHYGPGQGYAGFSGRDASRSFVDLCFTRESLIHCGVCSDCVPPAECLAKAHLVDDAWLAKKENRDAIDQWTKFYEDERDPATGRKKYPFVGYVVDETKDPKPAQPK